MAENILLKSNLLRIEPGTITIENFIPGKVYKRSIKIKNNCSIPIIINLRSSDKSKLLLNKTLLKIQANEEKIINLVIHDKINYSSKKLPTTVKKLYIYITEINGELIDWKYEINLMYFCNNNTFINKEISIEKPVLEIPSCYRTQLEKPSPISTSKRLYIDKTCNLLIIRSENNYIASLKNQIQRLTQQIYQMKKMGMNNYVVNNNDNYKKKNLNLRKSNGDSFFIISDKLDDPKGIFNIDKEIEKSEILAKNKILLVENSILACKVKYLEEELAKNNRNNYEVNTESKEDNNQYNFGAQNDNDYYSNNYNDQEEDEKDYEFQDDDINDNNQINTDDNYE